MAVASGDLVMVHGRYTGWGPKPMIAVDIFRVENGKANVHLALIALRNPRPSFRTK